MKEKVIIIFGSGHLAFRLKKLLYAASYTVLHPFDTMIQSAVSYDPLLEKLEAYFKSIDTGSVKMIYLLDEKDENNLQLIIALTALKIKPAITASLFNENLIPHVSKVHPHLKILNPAKIAAPVFVAALYQPLQRQLTEIPEVPVKVKAAKKNDSFIQKLIISFSALIILAVIFFHFSENLSWIDSLYFVVVTVATVGYGDINLAQSSAASKLFDVFLILSSTVFIWLFFSLIIDQLLKKRIQLALGRKKYKLTNHIVVCGLGRLGHFIVQELLQKNEQVIVIEKDENSPHIDYCRQAGAHVYVGDGRLPNVLDDVNITKAKALVSVISNDALNLEIGLNARSLQHNIRLVLRIFDEQMADKIRDILNIHLTLSASAIADDKFYKMLEEEIL
jgi:TrkA-N domain/Ion channel